MTGILRQLIIAWQGRAAERQQVMGITAVLTGSCRAGKSKEAAGSGHVGTSSAVAEARGGGVAGMTGRASLEGKGTPLQRGQASAAVMSGDKRHGYARFAIILTASLVLATAASMVAVTSPALMWHDGESQLLPIAAATGVDDLRLEKEGSTAYAMDSALHSPAKLNLHPSTLTLSGYPTVGGGAAELVFTVTYAGDVRQVWGAEPGLAEPPVVRLDVTGSGQDLYRVTNITSNIGSAASDVFEPYDHESETVRAELGGTYTVRAMVEFVAEGFISVYAFGFDADIVTVNVAASKFVSMPHSEYVTTHQNYLDTTTVVPAHDSAQVGIPAPEKWRVTDQNVQPFAESSMHQTFNATGRVMTENWNATRSVPVHGIEVCVYDGSSSPHTLLYTAAADPACDYTDTSGRYEVLNISRADPDDMTAVDVLVSVKSRGYNGVIDLKWHNPANNMSYAYNATSNMVVDYSESVLVRDFNLSDADPVTISGVTTNFVLKSTAEEGIAGAARIISAISDGMAFFEDHNQDPANLNVMWNHMDGTSIYTNNSNINGSYYDRRVATIYLDGALPRNATHNIWIADVSRDRHTILHEYGHHVHITHYPKFEQNCSVHYLHKKYDEACAWGEGWANLVPHLVDERAEMPGFISTVNVETGRDIRWNGQVFEFATFETSGRPVGEKVEGSVTAAMWDIADAAVDPVHDMSSSDRPAGSDNIAAGVDSLLGVFFAGLYDNFADFYDRWEIDMRRDSAEDVTILHGMAFSIPSNMSYYGFAGELSGVFNYEMSDQLNSTVSNRLQFRPNYVDVSDDGSIVAVTSLYGRGLQMVGAQTGEHVGLHATYGYDHACTLEENTSTCLGNSTARMAGLGPAEFSSMDGIAFGHSSSMALVSDWHQDRVQVIGSDGGYLGMFGAPGTGNGEFFGPNGVAFLTDSTTVAVADSVNSRIQTFNIAGDGSAQYSSQFGSYYRTPRTLQQLETGPNGTLYAAGFEYPGIWMYPPPSDSSDPTLIFDPSLRGLGGIDVDPDGLVYVSDWVQGRIRVYDPANLRGSVSVSSVPLDDRQLTIRSVVGGSGIGPDAGAEAFIDEFGSRGGHVWQLRTPLGVALGPPDSLTGDVRVYVADLNGIKMYEKDREMPRIESVWSHTDDKTVVPGDTVELAVNFSERVTVTGTPVLALKTGVAGSSAAYVSGSGSRTLTFNYTVETGAGPSHIDYMGIDSLSLGGSDSAKIIDGSGNAANLTLPERGTAGSLATNTALWIDASPTDRAQFSIESLATVEAVEHQQVGFDVLPVDMTRSYSLIGAPVGATISPGGMFTWTPSEAQNGMHAFVVNASAVGDPSTSHARTFRIAVAEDNVAPEIEPVSNMRAFALYELRFNIVATDGDLPVQTLAYCLGSDKPNYAAVLPNGTFMWTPSKYNMGTTAFNVSVADGFECDDDEQDPEVSVVFSITVVQKPPSVYALAPNGSVAAQTPVYTAGQSVRIAVEFSEPVTVQAGSGGATPYLELRTGAAGARAPFDSGNGTSTLVFAYTVRDGDATDRLSYAGTGALVLNGGTITVQSSVDPASTVLAEPGSPYSLSNSSLVRIDALRPTVESVTAPAGDGVYGVGEQVDIAARFSENVTVAGTPVIALSAGPANRDAAYLSGNATDTLVFRYTVQGGDVASRLDYTGTDALKAGDGASIADAVGNAAVLTLPAPGSEGSLGHSAIISIGDGRGGPAGSNVTVNIRPSGVDGSGNVARSGDEARIMINVGGLAAPGGAGTAAFPPGGAFVNTSFASVSFPPGVTASSVPADGLLVLYVADAVFDNSSVQGALAYDGSGIVVLQRVVEIGDEDARIVFDMPVRISLEGQASGRAFYAAGAGGAIMPIDRACAADDTERVHRQLDGTGECQIDADGDKVVYTYHLTRFGTVMSGSGAPPPVNHTCSMRVASTDLDVQVSPNSLSTAAPQSMINSGSLPFDRVALEASPWYINLGGAQPGPDTQTLPASITMVSEVGEGGPYRQVDASGTGVAERGLGGGQESSLWFKMDLRGQDGPQSGELDQYVTYVAECSG